MEEKKVITAENEVAKAPQDLSYATDEAMKYDPVEIANMLSFESLEQAYGEYEEQEEKLKAEKKLIHDAILIKFENTPLYAHTTPAIFTNNETGYQLIRTLPVKETLDDEKIMKLLPVNLLKLVIKPVIDKGALKRAIESRQIDSAILAPAITTATIPTLARRRIPKKDKQK